MASREKGGSSEGPKERPNQTGQTPESGLVKLPQEQGRPERPVIGKVLSAWTGTQSEQTSSTSKESDMSRNTNETGPYTEPPVENHRIAPTMNTHEQTNQRAERGTETPTPTDDAQRLGRAKILEMLASQANANVETSEEVPASGETNAESQNRPLETTIYVEASTDTEIQDRTPEVTLLGKAKGLVKVVLESPPAQDVIKDLNHAIEKGDQMILGFKERKLPYTDQQIKDMQKEYIHQRALAEEHSTEPKTKVVTASGTATTALVSAPFTPWPITATIVGMAGTVAYRAAKHIGQESAARKAAGVLIGQEERLENRDKELKRIEAQRQKQLLVLHETGSPRQRKKALKKILNLRDETYGLWRADDPKKPRPELGSPQSRPPRMR